MAERYVRLFVLPQNQHCAGAPVVIAAGALLRDTVNNNVLAQLKFRNIDAKVVQAIKVSFQPLDTVGRVLGPAIERQYLDLAIQRDGEDCQKIPILLPDASTRSFTVKPVEVVFVDGTLWHSDDAKMYTIPEQSSLEYILQDDELVKQYRLEHGQKCKLGVERVGDMWLCACGALNHASESACHSCKAELEAMEATLRDRDALADKRDERLVKEKEEADALAVQQKANRKKGLIIGSVVIVVIAALIIVSSLIKSNRYSRAVSLMEAGDYPAAIAEFSELDANYKDTGARIEDCQTLQAEAERKAQIALGESYLASGDYASAIDVLTAVGDYASDADAFAIYDVDPEVGILIIQAQDGHIAAQIEAGEYYNAATLVYKYYSPPSMYTEAETMLFDAINGLVNEQFEAGEYENAVKSAEDYYLSNKYYDPAEDLYYISQNRHIESLVEAGEFDAAVTAVNAYYPRPNSDYEPSPELPFELDSSLEDQLKAVLRIRYKQIKALLDADEFERAKELREIYFAIFEFAEPVSSADFVLSGVRIDRYIESGKFKSGDMIEQMREIETYGLGILLSNSTGDPDDIITARNIRLLDDKEEVIFAYGSDYYRLQDEAYKEIEASQNDSFPDEGDECESLLVYRAGSDRLIIFCFNADDKLNCITFFTNAAGNIDYLEHYAIDE